jgi:microcystin-dependent protein
MGRNLSNLYISESFQYLVQTSGSEFQNGLGTKLTGSYDITVANAGTATSALVAVTSVSSSYAAFATTASYALNVLPPINTGSFVITASATNATTTFTKADGSTFNTTINNVSNASSASVAVSSSYALQATSASYSNNSTSASYSLSSTTSSYSISSLSASYSNLSTSASYANIATSASYALNTTSAETASYATNFTASNILITGLATVTSASITYLTTIYETASVIYSSGSNIFGDASNDIQTLYGTVDIKTGPLLVTGSMNISGSINMVNGTDLVTHHVKAPASNGVEIQNNTGGVVGLFGAGGSLGTTFYGQVNGTTFSGSLQGTASYAINALSASYSNNSTSASYALSSSYAETGGTGTLNPIGLITMYGGSSAPSGWLLCDGVAYNRTTYSALYSVIGDSFGNGDGTTTFNVPNYQGRMPIGAGSGSGLTPRSLAVTGGLETHTLTVAQMPPHSHSVSIPTVTSGGNSPRSGPGFEINTITYDTTLVGNAESFPIMNPFLGINFIIKY